MLKIGKLKIDYFYIAALTACAVLYIVLPDKAYDLVACTIIVLGLGIADTILNMKEGEEK